MSIVDILSAAQAGQFFANAGKAANLTGAQAKTAMAALAPAIAQRLQDKAAKDPEAFDSLLDMLEDGGGSSDLEYPDAVMGAEALKDGAAILNDLYGSSSVAMVVLGKLAPKLNPDDLQKLSAISATSVLAALVEKSAGSEVLPVASSTSGGSGIIATIFAALVAGLLKGIMTALMPKSRRNYRNGRRTTTRRRASRPSLESIFREILTPKK